LGGDGGFFARVSQFVQGSLPGNVGLVKGREGHNRLGGRRGRDYVGRKVERLSQRKHSSKEERAKTTKGWMEAKRGGSEGVRGEGCKATVWARLEKISSI